MDNEKMLEKKLLFKITNQEENHNGFQYTTGINILDKPFEFAGSCVKGGLYFTDKENLHWFYMYGIWVRVVKIPDGANVVEDPDKSIGRKWRADQIELCERYPLYDVNTIIQLKLTITEQYIINACSLGKIDVLDYLQSSGLFYHDYGTILQRPKCSDKDCLYAAADNGHLDLLIWWNNSGLPLTTSKNAHFSYSDNVIGMASKAGNVKILQL
uniref:Ankyrin repeat protein n=1 Tax=viral metagenome TaxID=1070528 RepID=A0A6C0E8A1_9ZZZZ